MLAVGLGLDQVEPYLIGHEEHVKVAAINSSNSITLSGETANVNALHNEFQATGIFSRILQTGGNAYHSHHMLALGQEYELLLQMGLSEIRETKPLSLPQGSIGWFSSVTPTKKIARSKIDASYWRKNLESPVRFSDALANLLKAHSVQILVEIGPHAALRSPVKDIWSLSDSKSRTNERFYLPTLKRREDAVRNLLTTCGSLFTLNAKIDLAEVNSVDTIENGRLASVHGRVCVDLPTYTYTYGPVLYNENRFNNELRNRAHVRHDILGARQPGTAKAYPSWRNVLRVRDLPWLSHHRLLPSPVLPASAYFCMAVEAATQLFGETADPGLLLACCLRNVSISAALSFADDDSGIEVITTIEGAGAKSITAPLKFRVSSVPLGSKIWTEHCSGTVVPIVDEKRKYSRCGFSTIAYL